MSWLEDLEARLSGELEGFLGANPAQRALLEQQERRDRLQRLERQRRQLQQEAEQGRRGLLQLAAEIRCWQERVQRARAAAAEDLAVRADAHVARLMEQGRRRWQQLGELGQRFSAVEWEISQLGQERAGAAAAGAAAASAAGTGQGRSVGDAGLQDAWAAFEAEQELDALRQRLGR
jgi:hercynine metabolism protein